MAQSGHFGAKIQLTVDKSNTAKQKFIQEIQSLADEIQVSNAPKIKYINIDMQTALPEFAKQLQLLANQIQGSNAPVIKSLKLESIDASAAISNLRSQLENVAKDIKVSSVTKNTSSGGTTPTTLFSKDTVKETENVNALSAALKNLQVISQSVTSTYKSAVNGKGIIEDKEHLNRIIDLYTQWQTKIEAVRSAKHAATQQSVSGLVTEGLALRDQIRDVQGLEAATRKEARAANEASQNKIASLLRVSNLQRQVADYLKANPRITSIYGDELKNMGNSLGLNASVTNSELDQMRTRFAEIRASVAALGLEGKSAFDVIRNAYTRFGGWALITRSVVSTVRTIRLMITTVKDLDYALTDLKIITNETSVAYDNFSKKTSTAAKDIGSSVTELLKSSTVWARLGYSLNESLELAKVATIFNNVAGLDINAATVSLVSSLKAFNYEAENAIDLVDKFTKVGNSFAIDAAGIGEALQNSAAAMVAAGNDIDQSIALVTAGNLVTQDPSKVGNALKTTSLRIRGATADLEEMGEEVDELASSTSKLQAEIRALSGVDIMLDADTFKSTYDILKEISYVWYDISDVSQAAILEALAGKRNANIIASILQNFDEAEAVLKASANSSGAALEANEIRLDSITGKVSQFKAAFEELSSTVFESDFLKILTDSGTTFLSVLSKITDTLGTLPTLMAGLAVAFSTNGARSIFTPFQVTPGSNPSFSLIGSINRDVEAIKAYNAALDQNIPKQTAMADTMQNASKSALILANRYDGANVPVDSLTKKLISQTAASLAAATAQAILNAAWTLGISLLVSGVITAISSMINKTKEADQATKEAAQSASQLGNEITSLTLKYLELSDAVHTDQNAKEALISTQNELLHKLREEKISIEKLVAEYGDLDTAIKNLSIQKLKESQRDLVSGLHVNEKELASSVKDGWFSSGKLVEVGGKNYQESTMDFLHEKGFVQKGSYGSAGGYISLTSFNLEETEGILEAYEYLGEILDVISELGNVEAANDAVYQGVYNRYNELGTSVKAYKEALSGLNENLATQHMLQTLLDNKLPETQEEFDQFKNTLIESALASGDFVGSIEEIENTILDVLGSQSQFTKFNLFPTESSEDGKYNANLSNLADTINSLKSAYGMVSDAQKDMSETGGLSIDTIHKLASVTDNYLDYLYEENGLIKLNTEAWKELAEVDIRKDINEIEKEIDALNLQRTALEDLLDGYSKSMEQSSGSGLEEFESMIHQTKNELEELDNAIEQNQSRLRLYSGIFDSIRIPDLSSVTNGLDAITAANAGMNDILGTIQSYSDSMSTLADIQAAVANSFTVSIDKAKEFAAVYPEILNNATYTADGQLQLNEAVVNAFIEGKSAELQTSIDVEIAKLEAEKMKLEAKKASAEAQLELANAVAQGEVDIEQAKVQLLADAEQVLTQYLIDLGLEEVEAQKAAAEAKAGNMEEYARIVGEVADNNANNLAQSMVDAANATQNNVGNMVTSLDALGRQAANVAAQISNIADGVTTYFGKVAVGGGGTGGSSFTPQQGDYNFKGAEAQSVSVFDAALQDWIGNLELDISGYTKAIGQINGQIAALNALKNIPTSKFASGSGSGGSGGSGSKTKEIEEYIATINKLYAAEEKLKDLRNEKDYLDIILSASDSYNEQLGILRKINECRREEQQALHEINELRRGMITENVDRLRSMGFEITYEQDQNKLFVNNLSRINELMGETKEETNALRKEYESLIDATISLNEANIENGLTWVKLRKEIQETNEKIVDTTLKIYDEYRKHADDFDLWENVNFSKVDFLKTKLEGINDLYEKGLIPSAEKYRELIEDVALDIYKEQKKAMEHIIDLTMKMIKQEAVDKVNALKKQADAYQKIIDLKKLMLSDNWKEDQYQKELEKRLKAIAKLQSQIDQLALDDSREAYAERVQKEEELAKLQEELADFQAEHGYNAQIKALDKESDAHAKTKQEEIERVESTVDSTAKLYALAIERIDTQWDTLYQDLMDWNAEYGEGIAGEHSIRSAWDLARESLERYGSTLAALDGMKTENSVSKQVNPDQSTDNIAQARAIVTQMKSNGAKWVYASDAEKKALADKNLELGQAVSSLINQPVMRGRDGVWYIGSVGGKRLYDYYHQGGIVGNEPTLKQNEVMAVLEKGEAVLDKNKESALYKLIDFSMNISDHLGKSLNITDNPRNSLNISDNPGFLDTQYQKLNAVQQNQTQNQFSPNITVHLSHSGNISKQDTDILGNRIAETTLNSLKDAFNKKGLGNHSLAGLKP